MRVVELTAFQVHVPLRKPIRHASHARSSSDNLLVRCVLADNTQGFGEGVPRDYVTGETIDSSLALLKQTDFISQLGPCRDFQEAVALAERLQLAPVPGDDRQCRGNAARCAVELAILDAYGRRFGVPLASVPSLIAPELYEPRQWVRYSGAITSSQGWRVRLAAWRLWVYRFRQIKVKVGIAGQDDVKRLRLIRRRVGSKTDLRVDANEAWTPEETIERIRALEPFRISAVEQPVPHADADALAEIRKQVQTPIMLDESLCSRIDAERAIEKRTCDLFNLRLSKCGGFLPSLRLAQLARQQGLGYQLGCQVGETAVLSAAGRAFATSVGGLRYVEGSYDRHLVREALGTEDITFRWGGWAPALSRPGLGITLDPAALERVTRKKESFLG
jgi:L-alanine-DL-glutamate epimerase-like enolase superfamily enzyme